MEKLYVLIKRVTCFWKRFHLSDFNFISKFWILDRTFCTICKCSAKEEPETTISSRYMYITQVCQFKPWSINFQCWGAKFVQTVFGNEGSLRIILFLNWHLMVPWCQIKCREKYRPTNCIYQAILYFCKGKASFWLTAFSLL